MHKSRLAVRDGWEKHYELDEWTYSYKHFLLRGERGRGYDGQVEDIYGWVTKKNNGYYAGHPAPYDEETDSDATDLGIFEDLDSAMLAVENTNRIGYGVYC